MCTMIVEKAAVSGSGKGSKGWFELKEANVSFDHPQNAQLDHALNIDFVNHELGLDKRVAVEMSADSARRLIVAIEEALRVYSPTQFMVRRCVAPIEIDGQPLAAGDQVFIGLASANRDESLFPDPDRFDVDRANAAEHVAFGAGPHVCPGASLARLEAGIAVGAFLDRFERAELVSDEFEPLHTPMFYGPSRVLMRLTPA